jgi:hypothetical protein
MLDLLVNVSISELFFFNRDNSAFIKQKVAKTKVRWGYQPT